jgi:hypothetical protein
MNKVEVKKKSSNGRVRVLGLLPVMPVLHRLIDRLVYGLPVGGVL